MEIIEGNLIDVENREFYPCAISISEGKIINIERILIRMINIFRRDL